MMNPSVRSQLTEKFRQATVRPLRWADEGPAGDFEGRETTLEIFDVQEEDQKNLFLGLADLRRDAKRLLGESLRLIFHTPEATTRHYPGVRSEQPRVLLRLITSQHRRIASMVDEDIAGEPMPPRTRRTG